jgi:AcrR family transcriptional regulator
MPHTKTAPKSTPSPRSKRDEILRVATRHFGREGFEDSKWAAVAAELGVGSTALYHYFESKLHCLYVIMADALEADLRLFEQLTKGSTDHVAALVDVMHALYDLDEDEIMRNRVLVAEQFLVGVHRSSPREEEARQYARARTREIEFAWATLLTRAMEHGEIPEADPRLLARAVLGLHNSVWHWYHPRGSLPLSAVRDFYVARCLAVLGVDPERAATLSRNVDTAPAAVVA